MAREKMLVCGATGFIGRNLLEYFLKKGEHEMHAVYHEDRPKELCNLKGVNWIKADLMKEADVKRAVSGKDILLQAAAATGGLKDAVSRKDIYVRDNVVMNAFLFQACHEHKVKHVIFLSCTTIYEPQDAPLREDDFKGTIKSRHYFGASWTKVYNEKMCEFYSGLGPTKYTVIRHSNIYGPHDKYDLSRSHVFGATVTKVMTASSDKVVVWGDGSEERDLLHVDDLVSFFSLVLAKQDKPFELVNVGLGESFSVKALVEKMINASGRKLRIEYDENKPTIRTKVKINIDRAKKNYGWTPKISLDEGIQKTLNWYREHMRCHPEAQPSK